ncbi:MAG: energy transducer TonB [Acidobacteriota bacterium]
MTESSGKWIEGKRETVSTSNFDEQGRMLEFNFYPNAKSSIKRVMSYDREGNRQEKLMRYRVIDEATNKCELIADPTTFNVVLIFDTEGNLVGEDKFSLGGNLIEEKTYKFDTDNNREELIITGADKAFLSRCVEGFDGRGRAVEKTCFDAQGAILVKETYEGMEFDSKGNWVKRVETINQLKDGNLIPISKMVTHRAIHYYPPAPPVVAIEKPLEEAKKESETSKSHPTPIQSAPVISEVIAAKAIKKVEPSYPSFARSMGVSGSVTIEITIDERGKVTKAEAVSGPPQLRQAGIDAAKRWEYQPATANGNPIPSTTRITFNFVR